MRTIGWIILAIIIAWGIWTFAFKERPDETLLNGNDDDISQTEETADLDFNLTAEDDNKTFTYTLNKRFTVFVPLNSDELEIECAPEDTITIIPGEQDAPEGQTSTGFMTNKEGSCEIRAEDFDVRVRVVDR